MAVVWVRYTLLTAEMINWIDESPPHEQGGELCSKVDAFCLQLEDIMLEWKLEELLDAPDTTAKFCCLLADHISTYGAQLPLSWSNKAVSYAQLQ